MSNKYIIRNCPAWQPYEIYYCYNSGNTRICPVYKDCILKQIVELCKKVQELEYQKGGVKYKSPSKAKFGREILKLLDIQEVE